MDVKDDFFKPKTVSIGKGGQVTWHWKGSSRHNVTFRKHSHKPDKCGSRSKGSCTRRFSHKGTYSYLCTIHGSVMSGKVKVH